MPLHKTELLVPALALAGALVVGCAKPAEPQKEPPSEPARKAMTRQQPSSGQAAGVAPMGGVGAGPMTPVSGTEGLQGGGSAAGSSLKAKAKGVAEKAASQTDAGDQDAAN